MKHTDAYTHVLGKSQFTDDVIVPEGVLFGAVLSSPAAHARIIRLDIQTAAGIEGVQGVFTAAHIPGTNQIGKIFPDEPLLAEDTVHYVGQPIALVVAVTRQIAREAIHAVEIEFENLPAQFDPRQAYRQGDLIGAPRTLTLGDVESAWARCDVVVEGEAESGGQEHACLETHSALAIPLENEGLRVVSATQSPSIVQMIIARTLGLPMHQVEVEVLRLGGGFGGKEDQATPWAALAALAAHTLKRPVKVVLSREEDMRMTGKRHPYACEYKIGLTKAGRILAYSITFYQNAGAAADLSPAILERTLFHATNTYFIPNVRVNAASCRTNLPPNTAFRGFGGPQAMYAMEAAIFAAAQKMGVDAALIQKQNLLREGDEFPYGMRVRNSQAQRCWELAERIYELEKLQHQVAEFNAAQPLRKKGLALMPICFGISFTSTFLNQASALVHVYSDGSVSVSTAAVEMGQGVRQKIQQVAARVFSIDPQAIKVESTHTRCIANMSPTAASVSADLNGHATRMACTRILDRLKQLAARKLQGARPEPVEVRDESVYLAGKQTHLKWKDLVSMAYLNRVNLSAQAHYATPGIHYDKEREKGEPFAYHVFGTAITEVTLDCLRGTYQVDAVRVVHDFGASLNPVIERGQMEGGIVQGIGWMTLEELIRDASGRLLTDSLATYKVPDIYCAPREIQIHFLENLHNPPGIFNSKAIGEPPFMYGIGAYFALHKAMQAFRPGKAFDLSPPLTPEKVLLSLYRDAGTSVA